MDSCAKCGKKLDIFGDCDWCAEAKKAAAVAVNLNDSIETAMRNLAWEDYSEADEIKSVAEACGIPYDVAKTKLISLGFHRSAAQKRQDAEDEAAREAADERKKLAIKAKLADWLAVAREKVPAAKNLPDARGWEVIGIATDDPFARWQTPEVGDRREFVEFRYSPKTGFSSLRKSNRISSSYAGDAAYGWEGPNSVD
jgi:glutaredoxin